MMRTGLTVRINDRVTDRNVTGYTTGLKFKYSAPGGLQSASCTLSLPARTFTDLGPADRLYVYESASGELMWEGYTDNPGASAGAKGQAFELSATGPMARAGDERRSLVYIDSDLSSWNRTTVGTMPVSATAETRTDPNLLVPDGGMVVQFANGNPIGTGQLAAMGYTFVGTDMSFGAFYCLNRSGKYDPPGYNNYFESSGGGVGYEQQAITGMTNNLTHIEQYVAQGVGHPGQGRDSHHVTLTRIGGATNVADDATWTFFYKVKMLGQRKNRYGVNLTGSSGMASTQYVRADWVAEDLLGRLLLFCDPAKSSITATSTQITQLAYRTGTTAAGVLDDLSLHEPTMLWEILPTLSPDGRHVFNYRPWPTDVRYEVSTADGYNAPGGDNDLSNRIAVEWTDATKDPPVPMVTVRTVYVKTLADAGITRDAERVSLPDGTGSLDNAVKIGDAILATYANPPKAATVVVTRRLQDRLTGQLVNPWRIRPGYMVRVRETGEVLRLTEVEYDHDTGAATLTLGTPVQTPDQIIARLAA